MRTKIDAFSTQISECETDTKKLYNLIRYLTGTITFNPLPPRSSDDELVNEFADYFMNKINPLETAWTVIQNTQHHQGMHKIFQHLNC